MAADLKSIKAIVDLVSRVPIGEIDAVVRDLRFLLCGKTMLLRILERVVECYNKSHLMSCSLHGRKVLATYFNDMGDGVFCDPAGHQLFRLDHFSRDTTEVAFWNPDLDAELWRKFVDEACQSYVKKHYEEGVACVFASKKEDCITLTVCISHQKSRQQFLWSGNWRSVWILTVDPSTLEVFVKGYLRVEAHYHENGQVYMSHQKAYSFAFERRSDCVIGSAFVRRVEEEEARYLEELNEMYELIATHTLKEFRRALPIWKTSVNWTARAVRPPKVSELRALSEEC